VAEHRRVIGVDESGKGDFFGPLVVAAVLADDTQLTLLRELGARDSKKIAPKKLLMVDKSLRDHFPFAVIKILPEEYNAVYERFRNLNKLLAWAHVRAIEAVLAGKEADIAISDKFGKTERIEDALAERNHPIGVEQIVRGESIAQVAAASIIARAAFVRALEQLSNEIGLILPKGAAPQVDRIGREIVARYGPAKLRQVAKVHFKNYQRSVNLGLPLQ
jgi:ribonuclease HIII